jgi:hypothetical protein
MQISTCKNVRCFRVNKESNPIGRPLKFQTPEILQKKIDAYFKSCDENTKQVVTKEGFIVNVKAPKPYLVSGMAVALDTTRDVLIDYEDERPEFSNTIKKAKAKCLENSENRLFENFTPGVIFSMKNNWNFVDKTEVNQNFKIPNEIRIKTTKEMAEERKLNGQSSNRDCIKND